MWTLVYMAADENMIDDICTILEKNEIIYRLRKADNVDDSDSVCYEILVPDAEVFKAQELILELEIN